MRGIPDLPAASGHRDEQYMRLMILTAFLPRR